MAKITVWRDITYTIEVEANNTEEAEELARQADDSKWNLEDRGFDCLRFRGKIMAMGRIWVEVVYHEHRGGAGRARMWLDELPAWLDKYWNAGASRMVEQIVVLP